MVETLRFKEAGFGIAALALSILSWLLLYLTRFELIGNSGPHIWIVSISIGFPSSIACSLLAARDSKTWYVVSGLSVLSELVVLLNAPGIR